MQARPSGGRTRRAGRHPRKRRREGGRAVNAPFRLAPASALARPRAAPPPAARRSRGRSSACSSRSRSTSTSTRSCRSTRPWSTSRAGTSSSATTSARSRDPAVRLLRMPDALHARTQRAPAEPQGPVDVGGQGVRLVTVRSTRTIRPRWPAQEGRLPEAVRPPGSETGWHFLTGDRPDVEPPADTVGFNYALDPKSDQYAHPAGLVVATPGGSSPGTSTGSTSRRTTCAGPWSRPRRARSARRSTGCS